MDSREIATAIANEIERGRERYGKILSYHDGLSRIEGELAELRDAVRAFEKVALNGGKGLAESKLSVMSEAIQVAALAMRLAAEA